MSGITENAPKRNHNYKGGSIASNGYKIIYVGKDHHLADCRGYAYEHRVNAEKKIGRRLLPGEIVHHDDENKLNNSQGNLEVKKDLAHHFLSHRKRQDLRLPGEENAATVCACGCGSPLLKFDESGRPRKYMQGHNPIAAPLRDKITLVLSTGSKSVKEIELFTKHSNSSLRSVLSSMVDESKIIRIELGVYGLVGWAHVNRDNPIIECACGCGSAFNKYNSHWREKKFISGHNMINNGTKF